MPLSNILDTIIHADCYEVLRGLGDKSVDLVLTDPPYGINVAASSKVGGNNLAAATNYGAVKWDSAIPDDHLFNELRRVSKNQIVWGGNYFAAALGNSPAWLVWDKLRTGNFADCELAWTSFGFAVRRFSWLWNGMLQQNMGAFKEHRYHPTQKPVPLFNWCLKLCSKPGDVVLDPFAGSGTTALACHALGRHFICVERELEYVNIARNRLRDAQAQLSLFGGRENGTGGGSENSAQQLKGNMPAESVEVNLFDAGTSPV